MPKVVTLGEITCPSGELVLMDGGYLGLWSGESGPEEKRHDGGPAVDFEIVGVDADVAARSFDRQSGRTLYDIAEYDVVELIRLFDEHCREQRHDAALRRFAGQVPHRERVRRAVAGGDPGFFVGGVSVVVVGDVPTDRPLRVTAVPEEELWGWGYIRIEVGDGPVAQRRELDQIRVDCARFVFADADALSSWVHEEAIDGLADVVFWGRDEAALAAEFGVARVDADGYGWLDLPVEDAYAKALVLDERRDSSTAKTFNFDFRPHSHHWQVMAGVRAAGHEAATIHVGGADIMFAVTSVGDGFFPVHAELGADGTLAAIRISVITE